MHVISFNCASPAAQKGCLEAAQNTLTSLARGIISCCSTSSRVESEEGIEMEVVLLQQGSEPELVGLALNLGGYSPPNEESPVPTEAAVASRSSSVSPEEAKEEQNVLRTALDTEDEETPESWSWGDLGGALVTVFSAFALRGSDDS